DQRSPADREFSYRSGSQYPLLFTEPARLFCRYGFFQSVHIHRVPCIDCPVCCLDDRFPEEEKEAELPAVRCGSPTAERNDSDGSWDAGNKITRDRAADPLEMGAPAG